MLCEHCKKREATVKYVEVINGVKTEHNLCTQCAAHADLGQFSALFEGEFPLGKLLSGLLGTQETEEEDEKYSGNYWRGSGEYSGTLKGREDPPDGDEIKRRGAPGRVRGGREAPG